MHSPHEAAARIIAPAAWRFYDNALAPYQRGTGTRDDEAWIYLITWQKKGFRTEDEVRKWLLTGAPVGFEASATQHTALQASLVKATKIASLEPKDKIPWRDMATVPMDDSTVILRHNTHGVIEGRFSIGEWSDDTPISPREYSGDVWVLGDDLAQEEVEFGPNNEVYHGSITGWVPHLDDIMEQFRIAQETIEGLRAQLAASRIAD